MLWNKLWTNFLISLSLSVDDFFVGTAYGIRHFIIPIRSLAIMVLGSTVSMAASMELGKVFLNFSTGWATRLISALLLCGLGGWTIYKVWREGIRTAWKPGQLSLKRKPANAWEWFYLGAALGIDDFAEAFSLSVAGFPVILTIILFKLSELIMIISGMALGYRGLSKRINGRLEIIPGIVLILVGIKQLF